MLPREAHGADIAQGGARRAVPLRLISRVGVRADKGTSLEFTVCEARTLFRPHPQPLSHSVGEGSRALTCLEC